MRYRNGKAIEETPGTTSSTASPFPRTANDPQPARSRGEGTVLMDVRRQQFLARAGYAGQATRRCTRSPAWPRSGRPKRPGDFGASLPPCRQPPRIRAHPVKTPSTRCSSVREPLDSVSESWLPARHSGPAVFSILCNVPGASSFRSTASTKRLMPLTT